MYSLKQKEIKQFELWRRLPKNNNEKQFQENFQQSFVYIIIYLLSSDHR